MALAHCPRRAAPRVGAHSRARSRETVSGLGPEPGGKQGGALCPPAPGRAEARDRGGRAAVARARARPRPSRLLCFCFDGARVQLARVESRAAAARVGCRRPGRGGGSQTLNSPKTTARYSLVGLVAVVPLEQYLGSSSPHPCQSAVLPQHPPPFRAGDSTEGSSGPPRCVMSLGTEVPTSGSSTKLHGVINPRALELIPIPTHS